MFKEIYVNAGKIGIAKSAVEMCMIMRRFLELSYDNVETAFVIVSYNEAGQEVGRKKVCTDMDAILYSEYNAVKCEAVANFHKGNATIEQQRKAIERIKSIYSELSRKANCSWALNSIVEDCN